MFCTKIKSAVGVVAKVSVATYSSVTNLKMSDWQTEKEKFLSMLLDEKRKLYRCTQHTELSDIPTWQEYAKKKLAPKIPCKTNSPIDNSLNSKLTEKISIFTGDITTLEVIMFRIQKKGLYIFAGGRHRKCRQFLFVRRRWS
jgi:hypothetical protein